MDKQIELDVLVDGDELKYHGPHPESKRTYVVVNLEARTSYPKHIVEQTPWGPEPRDDPVTPYSIRVTNRSGKYCWLEILVDGKRIYYSSIGVDATTTVSSINVAGKQRELLFSWPRYRSSDKKDALGAADSLVGTICARLYDCVKTGENVQRMWRPHDCSDFKQTEKDDARAAGEARGEKGAVSTTAVGNSLGPAPAPCSRLCTTYDVKPFHSFQSVLHYRERHVLVDLGLLSPLVSRVKPALAPRPDAGNGEASSSALDGRSSNQQAAKRARRTADIGVIDLS